MAQESIRAAWDTIHEELLNQLEEVNNTKRMLNMLAVKAGIDTRFEIETEQLVTSGQMKVKTGQFFKKKLATSVAEILKMRGEPMTLDEIVSVLEQGSYDIKGAGGDEKVKESIRKNSTTFILLPGGLHWDLKSKYSDGKGTKKKTGSDSTTSDDQEESEPESDANEETEESPE